MSTPYLQKVKYQEAQYVDAHSEQSPGFLRLTRGKASIITSPHTMDHSRVETYFLTTKTLEMVLKRIIQETTQVFQYTAPSEQTLRFRVTKGEFWDEGRPSPREQGKLKKKRLPKKSYITSIFTALARIASYCTLKKPSLSEKQFSQKDTSTKKGFFRKLLGVYTNQD